MVNHYDILGVSRNADIDEIKAAFRRLAKQYHPDRNPNGKEYFEKVLLAYETLTDPSLKISYDYRLKTHDTHLYSADTGQQKNKNWRFDEREMKRRQYYNEHIRKYAKETASYNAQTKDRKNYNEYKYILFATPLAVALFIMIMKLAGPLPPEKAQRRAGKETTQLRAMLRPGDSPYNFIFGNSKFDTVHDKKLVIKNMTGMDAIVCIFSTKGFIRSFFIRGGYSAEVSQLPLTPLEIRYSNGLDFDYRHKLDHANVMGGFKRKAAYYNSVSSFLAGDGAELSLLPGLTEGFIKTSEKEFFTTTYDKQN